MATKSKYVNPVRANIARRTMSDSYPSLHSEDPEPSDDLYTPSFPALEYPEMSGNLSPLSLPLSGPPNLLVTPDYMSSLWLNEHILYCGQKNIPSGRLIPWYGWHSSEFIQA